MDEAVGEPIWSLPPDTLKLTQALPSPGWGGRCQAEFTQVRAGAQQAARILGQVL